MTLDPWIIAAAAAALALVLGRRALGGRRLSPDDIRQRIAAGAVVVDVRSPDEFRGGAYPGALNIPLHELSGRLGEIPRQRPVVLYCASGARSGVAAMLLRRAGYAEVVNAGGLHDMPR
ncbi:rhodanese-like domain-containing protein [Anaeromyxobacter diazotrophicus]|uniref:rhodanese-like domain-containing protein n=1 Tax=Anaeromyxobacter diazotrophicus TaxID=2590199 RepID=UPI001F1B529E|nr:rhodanese-like domain-containing protein [Anaeromyxobacter diazotrophicus]